MDAIQQCTRFTHHACANSSRTHIFKHTGASDCGSDGPCGRRRAWARSRVRHARDEPIKQAAIRTHTQTMMRTLALLQPIFCDVVRQYRAVLRLAVRLDVVCCLLQAHVVCCLQYDSMLYVACCKPSPRIMYLRDRRYGSTFVRLGIHPGTFPRISKAPSLPAHVAGSVFRCRHGDHARAAPARRPSTSASTCVHCDMSAYSVQHAAWHTARRVRHAACCIPHAGRHAACCTPRGVGPPPSVSYRDLDLEVSMSESRTIPTAQNCAAMFTRLARTVGRRWSFSSRGGLSTAVLQSRQWHAH
jgi:hypothetical protein